MHPARIGLFQEKEILYLSRERQRGDLLLG